MIESVRFENFKVLRDVELRGLQRLNVLVGPSGVGKTSVLEGLELLGQPKDTSVSPGWRSNGSHDAGIVATEGTDTSRLTWTGRSIGRVGALRTAPVKMLMLEPSKLGGWSRNTMSPSISESGEGLASTLAYLAGAFRDDLSSIERYLRDIVGITGRIRTFPDEIETDETRVHVIDGQEVSSLIHRRVLATRFEVEVDGVGWIPGQSLSEGTLIALVLLTVLHQPEPPHLLLLDDIDKGLHPSAQARLISTLRKILDSQPELQILATSHSPYLLDNFQAEEVQVMTFTGEGQVAAARLDTHPEWLEWKGRLQTGEFWATVGEDWVGATP